MKNRSPNFCGSRLKFVMQGSNSSGERGRLLNFLESQDSENEGFGVVGCVQGCKTGIPVKKHPYVCSLSSVGTGVVARLWVGL